jgi:ribose-phosphate pyrophosphokinase
MRIVSTEKSQVLSAKIAINLNIDLVNTAFRRFPDGELYIRTGALDEQTIIVGSVTDADSLVQLLLLIDACHDSSTTLIIPYLGYARQDKKFKPGEPVSARAVAQALSRGVERIFTVDIHEESILKFFDVPSSNISIAADIGGYIKTLDLEDPLILAPDTGASTFARGVAKAGNWDCDELKKTRISGMEVQMEPKKLAAAHREVVIVDDIISTGGTLATATGMLYRQNVRAVHAACVHGVFAGGAYARLHHAGVRTITASDTIECGCSLVTAADGISRTLSKNR